MSHVELLEERLTRSIIGAFFEVYNTLGFVVEAKSTYELHKAAPRQIRSYLQATRLEVGLLLHFGPDARYFRVVCSNQ